MIRKMLVGGVLLAAAGSASAQILNFTASLDGAQEVPPVNTPGYGFANVTLNVATGQVTVSGDYFELLSPVTAAHIHGLAPAGVNAGVIVPLQLTGTTSGTVSGMGTLTGAQVDGMIQGLTYINIHTNLHPGGEIRGQIIPSPGAGLAMLGLGGLLAIRRRR
jgi:hypothetical protein